MIYIFQPSVRSLSSYAKLEGFLNTLMSCGSDIFSKNEQIVIEINAEG